MFRSATIAFFFGIVSFGCTVKSEALRGKWVVVEASRDELTGMQKVAGELTLNEDGTFNSLEMPIDIFSKEPEPVTGNGNWKLDTLDGQQKVQLSFRTIDGREQGFGTHLNIGGIRTFNLYYYRGDPDNGKRIYFEKKK